MQNNNACCKSQADQDYFQAQNALGMIYEHGWGVDIDKSKAATWYDKAAKQGHADAQKNIGTMYYLGHGVDKDYNKASRQVHQKRRHSDGKNTMYYFFT